MANPAPPKPTRAFAELLAKIEENETSYDVREGLVYEALTMAKKLGYECGIRHDSTEKEPWPVVCIVLPNGIGEISWHCPPYKKAFTGYDTTEKYKRCHRYIDQDGAKK